MTDTKSFKTIAIKRETGEVRVFWGLFPKMHHAAALEWLAA